MCGRARRASPRSGHNSWRPLPWPRPSSPPAASGAWSAASATSRAWTEVESGYTGGDVADPSYEQVCSGRTGHAEAVRVQYDPAVIGYDALLEVFWRSHDPTQHNRQGPDIGTQYRSAIFYQDEEQREAAEGSRDAASGRYREPIATEITPTGPFYRAEEYHQHYLEKHGAAH